MEPQLEISGLIRPIYDSYKLLSNEWKNLFDIGLNEYLNSQTEKFYFTNTFIHRAEKVIFRNIYYPIKASYKDLITDFDDLENLLLEYKNITLVGSAGSGKTTVFKHIYLKAIEERKKIPLLIELRNLNDFDGDFEKLILDKVLKSRIKPNDLTFIRALQSGKFLFLLDGYDEIFSSKKQNINRQIEQFIDSYSNNNFLITTRPGSGIESFPRFYDFKVQELSNDDVINFITKIVEDEQKRNRIISTIKENKNYSEYLKNPLLLSMFIMAFESHPEIPKRKSSFYRNVFDTLYSRHDGVTKNSFLREKVTRLQMDDFENILSIFCYLTLLEGQYNFTHEQLSDNLNKVKTTFNFNFDTEHFIHDLRTSISILILDGFEYSFPHRSMQEYFTSLFVSRLPTEKKRKAYSNLSSILKKSSTDNSFNFWSLCEEMDQAVFLKVFLIPQLQKVKTKLTCNGAEMFNAFIDIYGIELFHNDKKSIANGERRMFLMRRHSFFNAVVTFAIPYSYVNFWAFPNTDSCEDELLEVFNRIASVNAYNHTITIKENQEIKNILIKYGILKTITKLRTDIGKRLIELKAIINEKKSNIDDFLNL